MKLKHETSHTTHHMNTIADRPDRRTLLAKDYCGPGLAFTKTKTKDCYSYFVVFKPMSIFNE